MTDAPERIWACVSKNTKSGVVTLLGDATFAVDGWQEYIRADRIEALTEQLAAAQHDAKEAEAYAEELEAKLATCERHRDAYAEMDRIGTQAVRDLEAKLEKAVEALEDISGNGNAAGRNPQLMADKARATLAELTGDQP